MTHRHSLKAHDGLYDLVTLLTELRQHVPDVHSVRITGMPTGGDHLLLPQVVLTGDSGIALDRLGPLRVGTPPRHVSRRGGNPPSPAFPRKGETGKGDQIPCAAG